MADVGKLTEEGVQNGLAVVHESLPLKQNV